MINTSKRITTVAVNSIRLLPQNPPIRTNKSNLQTLLTYMRERMAEGLPPLAPSDRLLIGKDNILGDGHRRLAALKILGVQHVQVEFDPTRTAAEIWRDRNSANTLNAQQVSAAAALGLDMQFWPYRVRRSADQLLSLAGDNAVELVVSSGISVSIVSVLRTAMGYCGRHDQAFGFALLRWMIVFNAQRLMRHIVDYRLMPPSAIVAAVNEGRALKIE